MNDETPPLKKFIRELILENQILKEGLAYSKDDREIFDNNVKHISELTDELIKHKKGSDHIFKTMSEFAERLYNIAGIIEEIYQTLGLEFTRPANQEEKLKVIASIIRKSQLGTFCSVCHNRISPYTSIGYYDDRRNWQRVFCSFKCCEEWKKQNPNKASIDQYWREELEND